jgi:cyclopropane fatty-acyl-phospholipid synthase-like methyltransferase
MAEKSDLVGDVPSAIDLRTMEDARDWANSAMLRRPWREHFFDCFVAELAALHANSARVLELGSGPGFLAERILKALPDVQYTMLDFSPAMHEVANNRLGSLADKVLSLVVDFKHEGWETGLGLFDAVVTMQAVHELRHKKHAIGLHRTVRAMLDVHGCYLVCDHYVGSDGMTNDALYMTVAEHRRSLEEAGFGAVSNLLELGGLVLHKAIIGSDRPPRALAGGDAA